MNPTASRKRLVLAVYLDYLFFSAVWYPLMWVAASQGFELPWATGIGAFAALDWLAVRFGGNTPGRWSIGIQSNGDGATVLEAIKSREAWWTILLGVSLLLAGSKSAVRWTQGEPTLPVFGIDPGFGTLLVLSIVAVGHAVAGVLILRCRRAGPLVGLVASASQAFALASSWPRLDGWIQARLEHRRGARGQSVSESDLELFQSVFPTGMVVAFAFSAVWLLLVYVRFRKPTYRPPRD